MRHVHFELGISQACTEGFYTLVKHVTRSARLKEDMFMSKKLIQFDLGLSGSSELDDEGNVIGKFKVTVEGEYDLEGIVRMVAEKGPVIGKLFEQIVTDIMTAGDEPTDHDHSNGDDDDVYTGGELVDEDDTDVTLSGGVHFTNDGEQTFRHSDDHQKSYPAEGGADIEPANKPVAESTD